MLILGLFFKPQHFQCVKNFKFKAIHSRRLCYLPAKHECCDLQDSAQTLGEVGSVYVKSWQI